MMRSVVRSMYVSSELAPDGRCSWWDSLAYNGKEPGLVPFHKTGGKKLDRPPPKARLTTRRIDRPFGGPVHRSSEFVAAAKVGVAFSS